MRFGKTPTSWSEIVLAAIPVVLWIGSLVYEYLEEEYACDNETSEKKSRPKKRRSPRKSCPSE